MEKKQQYTRLGRGEALGFKIADRKKVNPALSDNGAYNTQAFLKALNLLFGEGDTWKDGRTSYSLKDQETNVTFEAFAGSSGPSYGGGARDFENIETQALKADVLRTLSEFDKFLDEVIRKNNF